jgi:hypothetical protein
MPFNVYSGPKLMISIANPKSLPASGEFTRLRRGPCPPQEGLVRLRRKIAFSFSDPAAQRPRPTGANPGQPQPIPDNPRHIPDTASCVVRDLPTSSGIVRPYRKTSKTRQTRQPPPPRYAKRFGLGTPATLREVPRLRDGPGPCLAQPTLSLSKGKKLS